MDRSITISEENHDFWKTGAIISAVFSVITFAVFWNIEDPFWISIMRLGAFIFFAITILCYLQTMDGPLEITLNINDKNVLVSYQKKGERIHEEEFKKETIKDIFPTTAGVNFLLLKLKPTIKAFKVSFTDTDKDLYLFEFSGRPLLFSKESQKKVLQLFKNSL
ncbi:hypothetical protein CK503_09295 [Aliifodinibius salipaludis]|uniref:Uncharacterized protein n=1 Tax=Fodinibius salipaludis TaxID=2032627 RepID=A0A2A2GAH9_9BACT|nr:hypothetical protein [Aliifodinibius salipaludis]PAU93857.1 hypothetical protein CK503_09295 [Aliifodinibius salipaludis]